LHRGALLELLARYVEEHPAEIGTADRIRRLVASRADCFLRSCLPGHITASCWIVSRDHRHYLLTHHRKLDRWLQLGGHCDGDSDVLGVAAREAYEESGLDALDWVKSDRGLLVLDIDVHRIPARGSEPEHEHHDIRFLGVARERQPLEVSEESHALAWFEMEHCERDHDEESLLRMARKARTRLGQHPRSPVATPRRADRGSRNG